MTGTDINYAAELLKQGKLVAIPTETVYGLAGNALDTEAVIQIFEAKQRPRFNPLILHIAGLDELKKYTTSAPEQLLLLAETFWPGPLTILFEKKVIVHDIVTAGSPFVAVRVPRHPLALQLLRKIDFPLAAPSANPFGYISPTEPAHVEKQLGEKIAYILDGGKSEVGMESTIIKWNSQNQIEILRQGIITQSDLQMVASAPVVVSQSKDVEAPGMIKSHYAPSKKMYYGITEALLMSLQSKKIGVMTFKNILQGKNIVHQEVLSAGGNLHEAASNLFSALHRLDESDAEVIITEKFPEQGIGAAINDKLIRGSVN